MTSHAEELRRILEEFFDRRARGEAPSAAEYLARYPHLRRELAEHFETVEALDRLVKGKGGVPRTETVLGDFRIVREIGHGAYGRVFLAEQISLHRPVALKLLSAPLAQSYRTLERFRHEAEIAARLRHPNLVAVYAEGEAQGYAYYAMEHVEGISLAQLLAKLRELGPSGLHSLDLRALVRNLVTPSPGGRDEAGTPPPAPLRSLAYFGAAAHLVAEIADGLAYAHGRGVIHRDVKPGNVLLDFALVPHLADFGLAKETGLESLSLTGDLIGTPYYLSPEIAMSGRIKVDHRTDVYSLGVTLYELLTLRVPFSGTSSQEVLRRIMLEAPPAPRKLNHAVPRDLQVIALKAMEKDPDHRYASAAEMAEDLRRFLRFEPIRATPPGPIRIARRYLRRHRVAAVGIGLLILGGVVAAEVGAAAVQRARLGEALRVAWGEEQAADVDDRRLLRAKELLAEVLERDGENEEARLGVRRVEERIEQAFRRRLEQAREALRQAEEGWPLGTDLAAEAYGRALELREDADIRRRYEALRGVVPVSVSSEPPGAGVALHPVKANGELGPGRSLGETPLAPVPLRTGQYRFVVVKEGLGYGEDSLFVRPDAEPTTLHVVLRPTVEVASDDRMALIPAGRYRIGLDPTDRPSGMAFPELVAQEVETPAFYIDRFEVSNADYVRFVAEKRVAAPRSWKGGRPAEGEEDLPVLGVSWDEARTYAEWAGKRLPTEVEWEIACRGPEGFLYPTGNEFDPELADVGKMAVVQRGEITRIPLGDLRPRPVGSSPRGRSPFGVVHMAGNASEWVWDPWKPREGTPLLEAWWLAPVGQRVVRGGSALLPTGRNACTCVHRGPLVPNARESHVGFRCAKSVLP